MPLVIRSAALNDVPALLVIERQSPGASHWTSEQYNELVTGAVVLVAEQAGKICGFICARTVADEWEIQNVVVHPEFLRRGIANQLLKKLVQRAEQASTSAILLEVRESNSPARHLYEKQGFREVGRRSLYYAHPQEDATLYALSFT